MSLREIFTPFVSYVLLITGANASKGRTFRQVRQDIEQILSQQQVALRQSRVPASNYEDARFAAVCWADERILRFSAQNNERLFAEWTESPLQVELFQTINGGEEFYDRLARVGSEHTTVLEVFHLCLCLGFRGKYYDSSQDAEILRLRREIARHLPTPIPDADDLDRSGQKLTPQPYQAKPYEPRAQPAPISKAWLAAPAAAAVAIALVVLCQRHILCPIKNCGNGVLDAGETCEAKLAQPACPGSLPCKADCSCPPPPPAPPWNQIVHDLEQKLARLDCAAVTVNGSVEGVARLSGRVSSEHQQEDALKLARETVGVREAVGADLVVVPRPFCEVIALLEPIRRKHEGTPNAVSIQTGVWPSGNAPPAPRGCDAGAVLFEDETYAFVVKSTQPLGITHIDYIPAGAGDCYHELPGKDLGQETTAAYPKVDPDGVDQYVIGKPFGLELGYVVTSSQPLFAAKRAKDEPIESCIPALKAALAAHQSDPSLRANYCLFRSERAKP